MYLIQLFNIPCQSLSIGTFSSLFCRVMFNLWTLVARLGRFAKWTKVLVVNLFFHPSNNMTPYPKIFLMKHNFGTKGGLFHVGFTYTLPYILTKPILIIIPYNHPPYKLHVLLGLLTSERVCPHFFLKRSHSIGPSPIFLEHGTLPNIET
jgi:hypothetical protein